MEIRLGLTATRRSAEAMIAQIAYAIANPVACGAVRRARDWPGVQIMPEDIGTKTLLIRRPKAYFDPKKDPSTRVPVTPTCHDVLAIGLNIDHRVN